jgi:hypothetical protein
MNAGDKSDPDWQNPPGHQPGKKEEADLSPGSASAVTNRIEKQISFTSP